MAKVIDISIKSANKQLSDNRKLLEFLNSKQIVEEKIDGTKIQIIVKKDASSKKSYDENFIVAYKGNVLYPEEYLYNDPEEAKNSIGVSQYMFIWEMLKNVNVDLLPKGYQFFCEYIMKKHTLMSSYTMLHNLVLLAYGECDYEIKNGILITTNDEFYFDRDERKKLANILGIQTPPEVFKGFLYPTKNFRDGILYEELEKVFKKHENELENSENDISLYWKICNNIFLETPSVFGGKPEGYVFWNDKFPPLKIQQEYQLSKKEREKLKQQIKGSPLEESIYWTKVTELAEAILSEYMKDIKGKDIVDIRSILMKISHRIKTLPENMIKHPKKSWETVKDDIFLTAKLKLLYEIADKFALTIGKFRVFTKGHEKLIRTALKKYAGVVIALVDNKETSKYRDLRMKVLNECFKKEINAGKIKIISTRNGSIPSILNRVLPTFIGGLLAGSDRIDGYKKQLEKVSQDIHIIEIPRDENSISATKIINNINDEKYFKANTPKCVWKFYKDYLKIFSS